MENQHCSRHEHKREKNSSGSFLGVILIIVGVLWVLKEIGWHIGLPGWHTIREATSSLMNVFHFGALSVTWPIILLIAGVLLIAGRRLVGLLLILFAVFFILPHFIIPGILAIIFFPVLLVVLGIILISKIL